MSDEPSPQLGAAWASFVPRARVPNGLELQRDSPLATAVTRPNARPTPRKCPNTVRTPTRPAVGAGQFRKPLLEQRACRRPLVLDSFDRETLVPSGGEERFDGY